MKKVTVISFLILLLITNVVTLVYFLFIKEQTSTNIYKNPFPLIDPARSIIGKEHFLSTLQPIREEYYKIVEEAKPNKVGIYMEYLNTGANISINQEERFWPASLSKLPTAFVVMKKVEEGDWKLSNELILYEEDKDDRYGSLYKEKTGSRFTIEFLLKELLKNSDNTAHKIIVRNLQGDEYTALLEALGMEALFDNNYNITAKEYSRLFRALYNASYLSREHSEYLLSLMAETQFTKYIAKPLPKEILFSHKIGEEQVEKVFLDSGIVYIPNRPYLITVMVSVQDGNGEETAQKIMHKLSKTAYEYISKN